MKRTFAYVLALLMFLCGCKGKDAPSSGSSDSSAGVSDTETTSDTDSTSGTAPVAESSTAPDTTPAASTADTAETSESDPPAAESDPLTLASEQLGHARDVIRENGCIVGVAFVGYIDSELPESGIRDFLKNSDTFDVYCYLDAASLALREGAELYALTPLEDYSLTVYPCEITEECDIVADRNAPLYQGEAGESVVLRCNLSEIYSNVLVSVTNGTETVEFQPMLSMMDGHMITIDKCHDLSIYEYTWDGFVYSAYESLLSNYEIWDYVSQGMALRCTEEIVDISEGERALVFALGTERDDQFVNERFFAYGIESGTKYTLDPVTGEWGFLAEG